MKRLLILGAGGYGKTIADLARQMGAYQTVAFLDDDHQGPEILGKFSDYAAFDDGQTELYPGIGNNAIRLDWIRRLQREGIPVASLIHPTAYVSPRAAIGEGTMVLPMAMVATGVQVGQGCILNMGSMVDHDSVLEDGVHLSPGAIVKAENRIPQGMKVESAQVIQNREFPLK